MRIYFAVILTVLIVAASSSFAASVAEEAGKCPGIPKNCTEDVKCFLQAAERGDSYAQNNLGFIYAEGDGVTQNLIKAYGWWTVAAMNGIATARGNMDKIRGKMTPSQLEAAQFLAMECFMRTSK